MIPDEYYKDKRILVTGGVGSIGRELVKNLLRYNPKIIRIFDNNETGLFDLENELDSPQVRILIGDIRDRERLMMAFEDIDVVFHAAALKHVPLCEYNPFDAVKTNVLGTQNILEAALAKGVQKVINISTDKAVSPTNVMGATKLLSERLTISANYYRGVKKTVFSSVRFGNVLNSRGSVLPLFDTQIKRGGPVTITDHQMTRFFMDIPAASELILKAGIIAQGREIFILKMPAFRITDLAEVMIDQLAPKYGYLPCDISVTTIGPRAGEKYFEELMTSDESERAYEFENLLIIVPKLLKNEDPLDEEYFRNLKKTSMKSFSSDDVPLATKEQIKEILASHSYI